MTITPEQQTEIDALRETQVKTRRAVVPALEEILYEPIPVLDHGFVRVVDYMGDDHSIVQAARVSYGKGTKQLSNDRGLIRYLLRHRHTTPFEMCELKLHVKLPIFVARQWIRHRSANVNEYSARYSILEDEFYIPDRFLLDPHNQKEPDVLAPQSLDNKQGRGGKISREEAQEIAKNIDKASGQTYDLYKELLNESEDGKVVDLQRAGIARELARMVLPANVYTQWYWKIDLHNLMHFSALRADSHAQYEIRVYAEAILDIIKKWVPYTYEAFVDYRKEGAELSRMALDVVKRRLAGEDVTQENSGLTKREWAELEEILNSDAA